tara:strand:- start:121 stop:441 length:321 start_codon:yes stop_codon:yes gene_type:complete
MPKYNVSIEITSKSFHEDEIEAESETDAENVAKERFWSDEYEDDLNMNKENHDEAYIADEIIEKQKCPVCKHVFEKVEEEKEYLAIEDYYQKGYTIVHPKYSKEED